MTSLARVMKASLALPFALLCLRDSWKSARLTPQYGALDGVGVAAFSDAQQGRPGKHDVGRDPAKLG